MPRKSAAAKMTAVIARSRLEPPSGLSSRERALFREVTDSLERDHLKLEDVPLLSLYVKGLVQVEIAARELASGSSDAHWLNLQNAGLKLVTAMAVRLRIGPKGRSPNNSRKPVGTAVSNVPPPWHPRLRRVLPDGGVNEKGERDFASLRRRAATERKLVATLAVIEPADDALCLGSSNNVKGGSGAEEDARLAES